MKGFRMKTFCTYRIGELEGRRFLVSLKSLWNRKKSSFKNYRGHKIQNLSPLLNSSVLFSALSSSLN